MGAGRPWSSSVAYGYSIVHMPWSWAKDQGRLRGSCRGEDSGMQGSAGRRYLLDGQTWMLISWQCTGCEQAVDIECWAVWPWTFRTVAVRSDVRAGREHCRAVWPLMGRHAEDARPGSWHWSLWGSLDSGTRESFGMCPINRSFVGLRGVSAWRVCWAALEMVCLGLMQSRGVAWSCHVSLVCVLLKGSMVACGSVAQWLCHGTEVLEGWRQPG